MRTLLILLLSSVLYIFPTPTSAQWRLDAALRLGRDNVKFIESSGSRYGYYYMAMWFEPALGWGADANIGYEFKHGFGIYSGLMYNHFRTYGGQTVYLTTDPDSGEKYFTPKVSHNHPFEFATVPLKLEYRCLHDIFRPYAGFGATFLLHHKSGTYAETHRREFNCDYHVVTPTFLYGIDLEYKRFILGVDVRRDQKPFMEEHKKYDVSWKAHSLTFRLGYRIF